MQELTIVAIESGALLLIAPDGTRYRVTVDETVQSRLRTTRPSAHGIGKRIAPKEIQAHIRAGLSAEEVSRLTGAPLDYVHRFEAPILAEREFVVETALNVPVRLANETGAVLNGTNFGTVIRSRLSEVDAQEESWTSRKDPEKGWAIELTFVSGEVQRSAHWSFDPKKLSLIPVNKEAVTLSEQGEISVIPRLRAVPQEKIADRFDSGAFATQGTALTPTPFTGTAENPQPPEGEQNPPQNTAELLEELRRRRGERDPLDLSADGQLATHPTPHTHTHIDVPVELSSYQNSAQAAPPADETPSKRRGRTAMPSWDEIVFGSRGEEES